MVLRWCGLDAVVTTAKPKDICRCSPLRSDQRRLVASRATLLDRRSAVKKSLGEIERSAFLLCCPRSRSLTGWTAEDTATMAMLPSLVRSATRSVARQPVPACITPSGPSLFLRHRSSAERPSNPFAFLNPDQANPDSPESASPASQAIWDAMSTGGREVKAPRAPREPESAPRATLDELWAKASEWRYAGHNGPITPYSTRSVTVTRGVQPGALRAGRQTDVADLARAWRSLTRIVTVSRVKAVWKLKRHERPVATRYRLRSIRHRKRFAAEVSRQVRIIKTLRFRGL